ncbi:PilZ domain-containing protein [bacterium]|nr:PilZ domain-containing protein [candidate division CSSED10-310 bacterium]
MNRFAGDREYAGYRNLRQSSRTQWIRPVVIETDVGNTLLGHTLLLSMGGAGVRVAGMLSKGDEILLHVLIDSRWQKLKARVVFVKTPKEPQFKSLTEAGLAFSKRSAGSQLWLKGKRLKPRSDHPRDVSGENG